MISSLNFCCLFFFLLLSIALTYLSVIVLGELEERKKIRSAGDKFEAAFLSIAVQDKGKSLRLSWCF